MSLAIIKFKTLRKRFIQSSPTAEQVCFQVAGTLCLLFALIFFTPFTALAQNDFNFNYSGTGQPDLVYREPTAVNSVMTPEQEEALMKAYDEKLFGQMKFFTPARAASDQTISVTSSFGWKGSKPEDGEVYILAGDCQIVQGTDRVTGPKGVVWIRRKGKITGLNENQLFVYLEKESSKTALGIELNSVFVDALTNDQGWFGIFRSSNEINLHIASPGTGQLDPDKIFLRADLMRARYFQNASSQSPFKTESTVKGTGNRTVPTGSDQTAGFGQKSVRIQQTGRLTESVVGDSPFQSSSASFRKIRFYSRHETGSGIKFETDPLDAGKKILTIDHGVTLVIEGASINGKDLPSLGGQSDIIDISADSAVIWTSGITNISAGEEIQQSNEVDMEIFLSGDIVFREGERVLYAKNMYYDVKHRIGLIRNTEAVIPIPDRPGGFLRVKADEIEQYTPNSILAKKSWVTTSMMGEPGYRLQSGQIRAETRQTPLFDFETRQPVIDPETGRQKTKSEQFLIAEDNSVDIGPVPVFYWPWMAMDTRDRSLYLRNLQVGNDSVFGAQVRTTWNPYQILNMSDCRPEGTDWDLNLDYLSKRGLGHGMSFLYNREDLFGYRTPAIGMANFYGISDSGTDNLGLDRRSVPFEHSYRYRALWKHRQIVYLPTCLGSFGNDWVLSGQLGTSSDRNFIPQYFEQEWYDNPNPETNIGMKKTIDNSSFSLSASFRLDDFYTQTSTLPKAEHYWLGKSLLCNNINWYEHTKLSYSQFRTTTAPYATEDKNMFRYLDWELASDSGSNSPYSDETKTLDANSFNFSTRHELDAPIQAGPLKVTPYVLGEYAFWGTGYTENDINRVYGRGGLRLNLPVWKVDSEVSNETFYLNGLAHKMNFAIDASWSDTNVDFDKLILYDAMDDWQIEEFRRRYSVTTYGGAIPVKYDERFYALRQGQLAGSVTSPNTEIADRLKLVRFEWQNRWQTKRGPVGKRHTIDWISFDAGLNVYPDKEMNYDENFGLADYNFSWLVGDRFSVLSSGIYDFFGTGQRVTRFGVMARRPWLGNIYVGVDRYGGPLDNTYLNASLDYRLSEKYAINFGTSYDVSLGENVGQNLGISRIGESFIFTLNGNINTSKDNWGVSLSVIPVFMVNPKRVEEGNLNFQNAFN